MLSCHETQWSLWIHKYSIKMKTSAQSTEMEQGRSFLIRVSLEVCECKQGLLYHSDLHVMRMSEEILGMGWQRVFLQKWKAASYHSRYTLRERAAGLWTLILSSILNSYTTVGRGTQAIPQKCLIVREKRKHLVELRLARAVDNANNVY